MTSDTHSESRLTAFRAAICHHISAWHILFVCFAIVSAVPVAALAWWVEHRAVEQQVAAAQDKHLVIARNLAAAAARYAFEVQTAFDLAVNAFDSGDKAVGLQEFLRSLSFRHICIVNGATGEIEHYVAGSDPGAASSRLPPERLAGLRAELDKGGGLAQVTFAPDGKPALSLSRALPDGRIAFALVGTEYLIALQRSITIGLLGHATIIDGTGRVIAHPFQKWIDTSFDIAATPPARAIAAGRSGVMQFYSPAFNADMIAAYVPVPDTRWGVLVPQPMSELYAEARAIRSAALVLVLFSIAGAAAMAWCLRGNRNVVPAPSSGYEWIGPREWGGWTRRWRS